MRRLALSLHRANLSLLRGSLTRVCHCSSNRRQAGPTDVDEGDAEAMAQRGLVPRVLEYIFDSIAERCAANELVRHPRTPPCVLWFGATAWLTQGVLLRVSGWRRGRFFHPVPVPGIVPRNLQRAGVRPA